MPPFMKVRPKAFKTWVSQSLSALGFWLFVALNFSCFWLYAIGPQRLASDKMAVGALSPLFRISNWVASIGLFCLPFWYRNPKRFLRRLAVLDGVWFGLVGVLSELYATLQPLHLATAEIAIAAVAQIVSVFLLLAEIRAWREHAEKH